MDKKRKPALSVGLIARGAIYIALGVVILIWSSMLDMLDFLLATVVAVFISVARLEHGYLFSSLVYVGISILSIILFPSNTGALLFALVFGWFPLFSTFLMQKTRKIALSRCLSSLAFAAVLVVVVLIFRSAFLSEGDAFEEVRKFAQLLSLDGSRALEWLSQPFFAGLSRAQAVSIFGYALFGLLFSFIFQFFLEKFTLIYIYRFRPVLEKARIVQKTNKKKDLTGQNRKDEE